MAHHNTYWEEKNRKRNDRYEIIAFLIGFVIILLTGSLTVRNHNIKAERERVKQQEIYGRKAPDFLSLEAIATAQEETTQTEGALDLEDFAQVSVV